MNSIPVEQSLLNYSIWTEKMWLADEDGLEERDFTIMSLGLGGEVGEVMEVVEAMSDAGSLDLYMATKEMGDVIYYWARICIAFGLDPLSTLPTDQSNTVRFYETLDEQAREFSLCSPGKSVPSLAISLSARVGTVLEILKKRVRDDAFDKDKFTRAMGEVCVAWCQLTVKMGLTPSQVLRANIDKIEDRHARGVMRGNGNDR